MLRVTLLTFAALACAAVNNSLIFAETTVVVAAGAAEEPRTGNQFEFAIAAATGVDDQNLPIAGGVVHVDFMSSTDGIKSIRSEVERVEVFTEFVANEIIVRAEIACIADVKLRSGRRLRGVPGTVCVSEQRKQSLYFPEVMLQEIKEAAVFSGGSSIGAFEPEALVVSLGEGTSVESEFQAAVAIGDEGQATGQLSLLANRENGDLVRVEGDAFGAAVRSHVGRRRLRLHLAGVAAVDVFPPGGNSPHTCSGDFTFVANEGPHGPFRIDVPDCRDPLAGIEGSDIGSGAVTTAGMAWPPMHNLPVFFAPDDQEL